jgi:DNA-binding transcriptional LysR family regulator
VRGTHFAELTAFVAVAEDSSFSKAARRTGIAVTTLSQSVRAMEERLGVKLLNRTTRNVALTDAGQNLFDQLRPLLDSLDHVIDSSNAFRDRPAGHLRLSVPPPIACFFMAKILTEFTEQYPDITIEVVVQASLDDIVAGRFDAGVHGERFLAQDMVAVRMTPKLRFAAVAAPRYLERCGTPTSVSDLHKHRCIRTRLPDGNLLRWSFIVEGVQQEVNVDKSVVLNNPDLEIRSAIEGLGIFYTFSALVESYVHEGRLVSLFEPSQFPEDSGFYLFYPSRHQTPAALRAFIDFIRKRNQG